jgi:3,4-dihydroxy 2-butanone 4-phosphate synthase / GTP cyclohydrolase II
MISLQKKPPLKAEIAHTTKLPTEFGDFWIYVFRNNHDEREHLAIVRGDVFDIDEAPTWLHSEYLTSEVMGVLCFDCREQLGWTLQNIGQPCGIVLYLCQEGYAIGPTNKAKAHQLQGQYVDPVEINQTLGLHDDEREYHIAAAILRLLGFRSLALKTNHPNKLKQLEDLGVLLQHRSYSTTPSTHNQDHLEDKEKKPSLLFQLLSQ